ncbi:MAG: hypothetical protein ABSF18_07075 [Gammaproteobacteria bacterium]|jgi:hypothetical protein
MQQTAKPPKPVYSAPTHSSHTRSNSSYSEARFYSSTSSAQNAHTSAAPPCARVSVNSAQVPEYQQLKPRNKDVAKSVHDHGNQSAHVSKNMEQKRGLELQQSPAIFLGNQSSNNKNKSLNDVTVKEKSIEDEHIKMHSLIEQVLNGIKSYRRLPRTVFGSHLGFFAAIFDNRRGLMRANVYHDFLANSRHGISQKCLMVYALLNNNEGPELKRQVMRATGLEIKAGISQISNYMNSHHRDVFVKTDIERIIRIVNDKPVSNVFLGI